MYAYVVLIHLLAATIWTGGHLILACVILPKAMKERSVKRLHDYESAFEKIGMPALLVQIASGLWLAYHWLPDFSQWFNMSNPIAHGLVSKFLLLALTVAFALHARFRVLPVLSDDNLKLMAWHIIPVTVFSVLFVAVGLSFRAGWLY